MKKIWGGVAAILCFASTFQAQASSFKPYHGWRTIDTQHFSIHYHNSLENLSQRAAHYFEEAYNTLTPKYEWKPWSRTQVVLTDSSDEANGLASTLPYNVIVLRLVSPEPESSLNTYDDWLKTLITHEFTHILHLDAYGGFWTPWHWLFGKIVSPAGMTPAWIKEGTAALEETENTLGGRGRAVYSDMLLRTAILNNDFPPIDRAAGVHWEWPSGQMPYIFGAQFMEYLKNRFGEEKLQQFHRKTQRNFLIGAINHDAKVVFGESYYKLWKEWQASLRDKYIPWSESQHFTKMETVLGGKDSYYIPTFSRDGSQLAYVSLNPHRAAKLILRDMASDKEMVLAKTVPSQMSFSPDGKKIAYSSIATSKRYYRYYDLFELDIAKKKSKRLTHGWRARDPEFTSDGKQILFVKGGVEKDQLKLYDVATKQSKTLVSKVDEFTQFAGPRYSPDGSQIAVARYQFEKGWEICLYRAEGVFQKCLTHNGLLVDSRPNWTPDGQGVVYSSEENGVPNIYLYDLRTNAAKRLTNVASGVFQPTVSLDGKSLLVRYYTGDGFDVRKMDVAGLSVRGEPVAPQRGASTSLSQTEHTALTQDNLPVKKYSPLKQSLFLPRYVLPGFYLLDNGLLLSAAIGSNDPLYYHNWVGGVTYRTDAKHLGYFGRYVYNRFKPVFGLGLDDYAVDYGNLSFTTGNTYHFFEERRRAFGYVSMPIGGRQAFSLSYFYEDRLPVTNILAAEAAALNLGIYSGIGLNYVYGQTERFPASISNIEKGRTLRLSGTLTDARLGSAEKNEQKIFTGDYREYIPLGKNHVFAVRMAGGIAHGDSILPGTFSLGGSLGEGGMAGQISNRSFSLRGLPVGTLIRDRVMLMSGEYRLPLISPQRGLGTWPLFLNNMHLGFFADYGDAWDARDVRTKNGFQDFFNDFFLGVGAELRMDLVIGHGLPLTGRLGYARIVVNEDRLGNLKDPFLGNKVKDGIFILQFGTPF